MTTLWLVDPTGLAFPTVAKPTRRDLKIGSNPLIDLAALQQAIESGGLGDDDVWLATTRCNTKVQDLKWTIRNLLDCVGCLQSSDHRGAEWCDDGAGQWFACDAYAIRYDDTKGCRSRHGLEFYLKFSIDEDDFLMLIMVSVHLSQ